MPNPNAVVDVVQRLDPPLAARTAAQATLTVHLRGGVTAQLDLRRPSGLPLAGLLDDLRQQGALVYLDIDPTTRTVARLLLPRPAVVLAVAPGPVGDRHELSLDDSHAHYFLRVTSPDYKQFLADLTASARQGTPVLVTYALDVPEIVDVRPVPQVAGLGVVANPVPPAVAPAVAGITPQQAQQAFGLATATNCSPASPTPPCIPFEFPRDGCWGRAHEMGRLLAGGGFGPRKVWIFGSLRVQTRNDPNCVVHWGWHVAPTLLVNTGVSSEAWVIDPSMFQAAVPQATWVAAQNDPGNRTLDTAADVFYRDEPGASIQYDPMFAQTNAVLARYRNELRARTAQYGSPPFNCP
jgi:hypothetical protein